VVVVTATIYALHGLASLDRDSVDLRFHTRGDEAPDPGIVIVAVDDKALAAINQVPPIPRSYYARAFDQLKAADVRLIMVDVQFIGAGLDASADNQLVDAIGRDGPVVLAAPDFGSEQSSVPAGRDGAPGAVLASAGVDVDQDGILRQMMFRQVDRTTLAVQAAQLLTGRDLAADFVDNHAWIDFRGGPGSFTTVSLIDLVNGTVPPSELAGKTVLVGVTAPVEKDVFVTSVSSTPMSGVEVNANALQTLLRGIPLRSVPSSANVILILLAAMIPFLLASRWSGPVISLGSLLASTALLVGTQSLFDHGWIISVVYPVLALTLGLIGAVAVESLIERRQRRALEGTLSNLIRPARFDFFISYRRDQSAFAANVLRRELVQRFGEPAVFMDTSTINAGDEWPRAIRGAIRGCSVMLVLIGPHWSSAPSASGGRRLDDPDDWVRLEVETGLRQEQTVVVPLLLDGATIPTEADLPSSLAALSRREAFTVSGTALGDDVDRLLRAVQRVRATVGQVPHLVMSSGNS
jgi:CHASE2 domain-containing sensor protein